MERDSTGGQDVGRDIERDLGDEPPASIRDAAPDYLSPDRRILPGHPGTRRRPNRAASAIDSPEHDWEHAKDLIYPAFRPVGTQGLAIDAFDHEALAGQGAMSHAQPMLDVGPRRPAGRLHARRRRVRHRRQRRPPDVVGRDGRRDPGRGDAQPVALVGDGAVDRRDLRRPTARQLGHRPWLGRRADPAARGDGPSRDRTGAVRARARRSAGAASADGGLAVARRTPSSPGCSPTFVLEQSGGADEPIDRRVFELVDGRLVEFDGGGFGGLIA